MSSYYGVTRSSEYLAHYGIKGMKWGVRRALEKRVNKYATLTKNHRNSAKEMRYWEKKTAQLPAYRTNGKLDESKIYPGQALYTYRTSRKDFENKANKFAKKQAKANKLLKQYNALSKRIKNRKYFTNQDFKDALGAGLIGAAFGPYAGMGYTMTKNSQRIANEIPANNNRHGKKRRRT